MNCPPRTPKNYPKVLFFNAQSLKAGSKTKPTKTISWISDFGWKISLNFGEDLFFFLWRPPVFERKQRLNFRLWPKNQSQFLWRPFFLACFWAEKNVWISDFGPKISLNFGEDLFFFFYGDHLFLGGFREILLQEQWKFGSRSFALFSLFQNLQSVRYLPQVWPFGLLF